MSLYYLYVCTAQWEVPNARQSDIKGCNAPHKLDIIVHRLLYNYVLQVRETGDTKVALSTLDLIFSGLTQEHSYVIYFSW